MSRRAWARDVLRIHIERNGNCGYCLDAYATKTEWPCLPARAAIYYGSGKSPR